MLALLATVALAAAVYLQIKRPQLELGVGYGARVACACRYIGNRPLGNCKRDFEPGMEMIRLSENPVERSVTASVPFIARRTVRFDPILGCQPELYKGRTFQIMR